MVSVCEILYLPAGRKTVVLPALSFPGGWGEPLQPEMSHSAVWIASQSSVTPSPWAAQSEQSDNVKVQSGSTQHSGNSKLQKATIIDIVRLSSA
jgi:hypothetical protein